MAFKVDPDTCIGCGLCTGLAQDVFELTDAGVATVVEQPGPDQKDEAREALASCPVAASYEE